MQASSPSDTKLILPQINIVFNWAFISEQILIKFPRISYKCDINVTLVCLSFLQITVTDEPDTLLQKVLLLVKGHDRAVLDSYEFFVTMAANELGIKISKV